MVFECLMKRQEKGENFGMNYEELYAALQPLEKDLKDSANAVVKHQKAIAKNTETGNLTEMKKSLEQLRETVRLLSDRLELVAEQTESFDTLEYFKSGDFARQLLEACKEREIDVRGEKGVYEMFPYKVRIYGDDEHAEEVWIDRKKQATYRPVALANTIKTGQDKLYKAKFNEEAFMNELAEAYDTTCAKTGARDGSQLMLTKIYKTLTPMARTRKEYDMQAFAFDLAKLYELGPEAWKTKSGRSFIFGTSRNGSGIRVVSSSGVESYINTLRPLTQEE